MSLIKVNRIFLLIILLCMASCAGGNFGKKDKTVSEKKFDLYYSEGTANLLKKDYTTAMQHFLKALEINSNDSKLLNNLGMTYFFKKRPTTAKKYLLRSISIDPKNSDARNNLASLYYVSGDLQKAKEHYKEILKDLIYPSQYRIHYNLGLIYSREKKYKNALHEMTLATEGREDYCAANFQLGLIQLKTLNYTKAAKSFLDAQQGTCVKEPLPHWYLALTYVKMNKLSFARKKFNAIIERFSTTKFSAMASNQLRKISSLEMIQDKEDIRLKEKYFGKK